jgi:hypothetical protein
MNAAISPSVMTLAVALTLSGLAPALAESMPDAANGRYTLQPSGDGVIRLDTRTGTVSSCSNSGAGWACPTSARRWTKRSAVCRRRTKL